MSKGGSTRTTDLEPTTMLVTEDRPVSDEM
jgi:hypothetical protein